MIEEGIFVLKTLGRDIMLNSVLQPEPAIISDSITKNWTEQAIECYRLNGDCSKCSIMSGHYSFVCQMPKIIEILKTVVGEPELD